MCACGGGLFEIDDSQFYFNQNADCRSAKFSFLQFLKIYKILKVRKVEFHIPCPPQKAVTQVASPLFYLPVLHALSLRAG